MGGGAVDPEIPILPDRPCPLEIVAESDACSVETGCVVVRNQSETDACESDSMFLVWLQPGEGLDQIADVDTVTMIIEPGDLPIEPAEARHVDTGFNLIGFGNEVRVCVYYYDVANADNPPVELNCSERFLPAEPPVENCLEQFRPDSFCELEIVTGNDACSVETGCIAVRNQSETGTCESDQMYLEWLQAEGGQEPMPASGQTMIIRPPALPRFPGDYPIEPGETRHVETGFSPFIRPIGFENHVWACIYGPGRVRRNQIVEWDCSRRFRNVRF